MPLLAENSRFFVVQCQSRKGATWCDWFKWYNSAEQASQWIEEQESKQQRYGLVKMNYRIRRIGTSITAPELPSRKTTEG